MYRDYESNEAVKRYQLVGTSEFMLPKSGTAVEEKGSRSVPCVVVSEFEGYLLKRKKAGQKF